MDTPCQILTSWDTGKLSCKDKFFVYLKSLAGNLPNILRALNLAWSVYLHSKMGK